MTALGSARKAFRKLRQILRRLRSSRAQFQPYTVTAKERYSVIFKYLQTRLGDGAKCRILSFGCASGEEVFSLAKRLPQASLIKGIDISPDCIRRARKAMAGKSAVPPLQFEQACSVANEPGGYYDAVLAMAVFRHGDIGEAESCTPYLHFADFDQAIAGLARIVKPGGFLAIRHAAFRFSDTAAASGFRPVMMASNTAPQINNPLFGRDDRRISNDLRDDGVYEKL